MSNLIARVTGEDSRETRSKFANIALQDFLRLCIAHPTLVSAGAIQSDEEIVEFEAVGVPFTSKEIHDMVSKNPFQILAIEPSHYQEYRRKSDSESGFPICCKFHGEAWDCGMIGGSAISSLKRPASLQVHPHRACSMDVDVSRNFEALSTNDVDNIITEALSLLTPIQNSDLRWDTELTNNWARLRGIPAGREFSQIFETGSRRLPDIHLLSMVLEPAGFSLRDFLIWLQLATSPKPKDRRKAKNEQISNKPEFKDQWPENSFNAQECEINLLPHPRPGLHPYHRGKIPMDFGKPTQVVVVPNK